MESSDLLLKSGLSQNFTDSLGEVQTLFSQFLFWACLATLALSVVNADDSTGHR